MSENVFSLRTYIIVLILFFSGILCVAVYERDINPPSEVNIQMKVLDKNVNQDKWGTPIYTVTLASDKDTFVYKELNSIQVYTSVEVGKSYTCTYYDYCVSGYTVVRTDTQRSCDDIVKINGVSVE